VAIRVQLTLRAVAKTTCDFNVIGRCGKRLAGGFLAQRYGLHDGYICLVGLAAFIGHLYPVFCGFKGGKGVATALGVMLAFSAWLGLGVLLVWIVAFLVWRYSSLAALLAAAISPVLAWVLLPYTGYTITALVLALILIWRHKSNIEKLMSGTESGFGKK